ncbi:hypothetical protein KORDIASMS9_01881 [Kordia sp. SMS9]|uniref:hypothetical protein n=1 Tax=Kordia sp. SMS9 TaxID=2282170 RepID=UPI000E0D9883|nr:hypothetical protein [Kordia sp. SMS9]AXG69655.1 hypothetical protein KORDIASMS9_01881 [Kordia sp. SMS9]
MNTKLEFCKTCVNRSFSSANGIVCGLTNEKPNFVLNCPDFEKDIKEEKRIADRKAMLEAEEVYDDNGKSVPTWKTILSIVIFIIVVVRLIMRLSK